MKFTGETPHDLPDIEVVFGIFLTDALVVVLVLKGALLVVFLFEDVLVVVVLLSPAYSLS